MQIIPSSTGPDALPAIRDAKLPKLAFPKTAIVSDETSMSFSLSSVTGTRGTLEANDSSNEVNEG